MMKKFRRKIKKRCITTYVPEEIAEKFFKKVHSQYKTMSAVVLELIKNYVEEDKKEE